MGAEQSKNNLRQKNIKAKEEAAIMENINALMKRRDTIVSATSDTINFNAHSIGSDIPVGVHTGGARIVPPRQRYARYNTNIVDQNGGLLTEFDIDETDAANVEPVQPPVQSNFAQEPTPVQSNFAQEQPPAQEQPQPQTLITSDDSDPAPLGEQEGSLNDSDVTFRRLKQELEKEVALAAQLGGGCGCTSSSNNEQILFGGDGGDSETSETPSKKDDSDGNDEPSEEDDSEDAEAEESELRKRLDNVPNEEEEDDSPAEDKKEDGLEYSLTADSVSSINLVPFYSTPESSFNNSVQRRKRF